VLAGQVFQAEDASFAEGAAFRWPASVEAPSAADRVIEIAVPAGQSFRARGVLAAESLWVKVTPDATAFLPTIQRVNSLDAAPEKLVVVARALMDSAFSGLASPVLMDPSAAQIIIMFADRSGDPIPRLSLAVPGAEAIAYRAGGGFNDVTRETDASGLVLAANVPAGVWLTDVRGTVSGSTTNRSFTIRAARGAVTVARVTVAR
jgi:hypothetical protein